MPGFGSCIEETRNKVIVCEERGRKFIGKNNDRKIFLRIQVDHCLELKGKRCDWLLVNVVEYIAHFIELKGSHLKHALLQLGETIEEISKPENKYIQRPFKKKFAYAVLSRCPANSTAIQVEKAKFMKKYHTRLRVRNNRIQCDL